MKIIHSFWKNGSGGFGFGVWRVKYPTQIIWTVIIGPLNLYIFHERKQLFTKMFRPIGYVSGNGEGQGFSYGDKEEFGYGDEEGDGRGRGDGDGYGDGYGRGITTIQFNIRRRS